MDREELWAKLRRQVEKGSPKAHVTLAKLIELERVVMISGDCTPSVFGGINREPMQCWRTGHDEDSSLKSMEAAVRLYRDCK